MKVTVIVEPGRVQVDAAGSAFSALDLDQDVEEITRELVAAVREAARRVVRSRGRRELVHVDGVTAWHPTPTDPEDPPCPPTTSTTPSPASASPSSTWDASDSPSPSSSSPIGAPTCAGPTPPADDYSTPSTPPATTTTSSPAADHRPAITRAAIADMATDHRRPKVPPEIATDSYVRAWCVKRRIPVSMTGDVDPQAREAYRLAYHGEV